MENKKSESIGKGQSGRLNGGVGRSRCEGQKITSTWSRSNLGKRSMRESQQLGQAIKVKVRKR